MSAVCFFAEHKYAVPNGIAEYARAFEPNIYPKIMFPDISPILFKRIGKYLTRSFLVCGMLSIYIPR